MKIFVSVLGQVDNVGDTVLRRAYLDALRPAGQLQVYVGERDSSYLSGLGLAETDVLVRSRSQWRRAISRASLREASVYAFNAGEMEVRRTYAMQYVRLAPLLAGLRLRGGHVIHAGFGVRRPTGWRIPIALTLRMADIVSWRDTESRAAMGLGRVAPDWAFAAGSPDVELAGNDDARQQLAVSIRYNGKRPDATWVQSVSALADALGLSIVVVAQILRDGPLATELAGELGGEAAVWEGPDHATQEEKLRSVYRRSRILVTNRLHAAVMALTEGALPLALGDPSRNSAGSPDVPDKVTRTLAAAGITGVTVDEGLPDAAALERTAREVLGRRDTILQHVVDARHTLDRLTADMRRLTG
ncbi:MAG TPA: polysaccharide pyruvyl transferase family protein [Glaciibacter sp.]|nr:polysaccharide pyruvyl transferase family protein [Glaciibacter sp.]